MLARVMVSVLCGIIPAAIAKGASEAETSPLPQMTNSLGMKFVLIPAGKFVMGSPSGEWGRGRDEEPQREITITRPFYIAIGETTNGDFLKFVEETKYDPIAAGESDNMFLSYQRAREGDKYYGKPINRPDHPAIWVSWYAACRFCNWLSEREGLKPVYLFEKPSSPGHPPLVRMAHPYDGGYRLPTEAEFEYAARAGTTTPFSFGPDVTKFKDHAFSYLTDNPPAWGGFDNEASISRKPNPWGLYQMHGNAQEWCWDRYAPRYDPNQTIDPLGPEVGEYRVTRGGAMRSPVFGRSAARVADHPLITRNDVSFRVVRNPAGKHGK